MLRLGEDSKKRTLTSPIPLMVLEEPGDFPNTSVTIEREVVPVPEYSKDTYSSANHTISKPGASINRALVADCAQEDVQERIEDERYTTLENPSDAEQTRHHREALDKIDKFMQKHRKNMGAEEKNKTRKKDTDNEEKTIIR